MSSLKTATNTFILLCVTLTIVRKAFCIVKHYAFNQFVLQIIISTNNLEKWLNEKLICKEILQGRSQSKKTLLDKEKMSRDDDRVNFNIIYYLVFKNLRNILEEFHILLAPDEQQRKVFADIPRIGFQNSKV